MSMYRKLRCTCPEHEGSDFWNDPHLWCGVDPTRELCWQDKPGRACDVEFDYEISPDYWAEQRRHWLMQQARQMEQSLGQNMLSAYRDALSPLPGPASLGSFWNAVQPFK